MSCQIDKWAEDANWHDSSRRAKEEEESRSRKVQESWSVFLMRCGTDTRGKENGVRVLQCMGIGPKNCKT
jgi:hypothetical protein